MPELSEEQLGYMQTPNGNVVELARESGGGYFTREYKPVQDSEISITRQQAIDYLRIMRSCNGIVSNAHARPHLVAEEETTA